MLSHLSSPTHLLMCSLVSLVCLPQGKTDTMKAISPPKSLSGKTFRVTTLMEAPLVMKEGTKFVGLYMDILNELQRRGNFSVKVSLARDGQYGFEQKPGVWTGMIGELINNQSDIAVASLSVVSRRAVMVDYTQPVMHSGCRILYKLPSLWTFTEPLTVLLTPFSPGLWIVIVLLFVAVSVLLYLIGRFSPYEEVGFVGKAATYEGLTLPNSFLYTFSSLTWQGYTAAPRSISGRLLAAFWWIFVVFVITTYTANLAALFLTREPNIRTAPFMTFDELSRQRKVAYGTLKGGSTAYFFNRSTKPIVKRMSQYMNSHPDVMVSSVKDGIKKVRDSDGKYAFIMEGPPAEFLAHQEPCDLIVLAEPLNDAHYGFACRRGPDINICKDLDHLLLAMQEEEFVHERQNYWLKKGCHTNPTEQFIDGWAVFDAFGGLRDVTLEQAVSIRRFGGPFLLLGLGIVLSVIFLLAEIYYAKRSGHVKQPYHISVDQDRLAEDVRA